MVAMFVNLTNWDKMSNLDRGLSIDVFYRFSVHLAKRFQGEDFLELDQSETRIASGGHAFYRIGTKLATL